MFLQMLYFDNLTFALILHHLKGNNSFDPYQGLVNKECTS